MDPIETESSRPTTRSTEKGSRKRTAEDDVVQTAEDSVAQTAEDSVAQTEPGISSSADQKFENMPTSVLKKTPRGSKRRFICPGRVAPVDSRAGERQNDSSNAPLSPVFELQSGIKERVVGSKLDVIGGSSQARRSITSPLKPLKGLPFKSPRKVDDYGRFSSSGQLLGRPCKGTSGRATAPLLENRTRTKTEPDHPLSSETTEISEKDQNE